VKTLPLLLLWIAPALYAQDPEWRSSEHITTRIARATLDSISARGRSIAAYDAAAWHGTDAVLALRPPESRLGTYLARQRSDGRWEVVFGRQSSGADTFYVAYRAVQSAAGSDGYSAASLEPDEPDTGDYAAAARALSLAIHAFGPVRRPYNRIALQSSPDEWLVYLVPAPTRAGFWPLGGDVRYRISRDGRQLREARRLHNTVLEFGPPAKPGNVIKAGMHSAVLDDRPEDTDVFYVLTRQPRIPEYIVSQSFYFSIDTTGHIMAYDRAGDASN
jgi:hypothetical protein